MKFYAAYAIRKPALPEDIFAEFDNFEDAYWAAIDAEVDDDDSAVYTFMDNKYYRVWSLIKNEMLVSPGPCYMWLDNYWISLDERK